MLKVEGKDWIKRFRIKLIMLYGLKMLFLSLSVSVLMILLAPFISLNSFLLLSIVFFLVAIGMLILQPTWKITLDGVSNYLNAKFPELEESASLFLKKEQELSLLEKFQLQKISEVFPLPNSLKEPLKRVWLNGLFFIFSMLIVFGVKNYFPKHLLINDVSSTSQNHNIVKENIPSAIKNFNLKILPPAYTKIDPRSQHQFTIKAEVNALIRWNIETTISVKKMRIIFNDKETINLTQLDNLNWTYTKMINQSGFYQIELDGKKSDLYQIETIPDLPVSIKIIQPKPHTTIDIGQVPKVNLRVSLHDDYGINDAHISATLSSGKGEGVSFTEKKLNFNTNFQNRKELKLDKVLDLKALGMKPGDELYFFVKATDNNGQSSRSDVYLVSIVDTAELMSMAGMVNGIDLVPEYFRSQRQIIIDTEKLLKEQGTLSAEEFKDKSNALGIDQKLLRLRYGKFLGEESETEIGGEHHDDEHNETGSQTFGNVQALMDEYAHKHDIAEDATFFDPEMKMQLKAVLNEMWSSELRLRTHKPQEALPFEYKALRLLKDLQQKSRVYVAKTTIKTTKLKLEKRLSGELDKIIQPTQQVTFEQIDRSVDDLKMLLSVLEQRKTGKAFNYGDRELLRAGEKQLLFAAANQPTSYLIALKNLRKISTSTKTVKSDIDEVQKAIQKLLGIETLKPQTTNVGPEANLYRSYFNHLKNASR